MTPQKTIFSLLLLLLCAFHAHAQKPEETLPYQQDSLVKFAESFVGKPYVFGGVNPKGFDCSGFVYYIYNNFDMKVPRVSSAYSRFGKEVTLESCQKGDIILFTGTNYDRSVVGHIGIIISDQGEPVRFIHSSSSKKHRGVVITDYINSGYPRRYMGIRRL
jgi:cell wall-associated NlpC family hydrolase